MFFSGWRKHSKAQLADENDTITLTTRKESMKKLVLIAIMAAALTGFGATIPMDTLELRLGGQMNFSNPQGNADWRIESGLGYFVFDNIEFGGIVDWQFDGYNMGLGLGAFGEANLDLDSFIMPYLAMRLQYCFKLGQYYTDYSNTSTHNYLLWEPAVGLKFFLSEVVAIYSELYFDLASEKAFAKGDDAQNIDFGLKTGVRCYF
jgi:hypothetical protein